MCPSQAASTQAHIVTFVLHVLSACLSFVRFLLLLSLSLSCLQVYTNSEQQMRLLITTGSLQGQQPQSLTTTAAAGDRDGAPGPMPYQQQLAAPPAL